MSTRSTRTRTDTDRAAVNTIAEPAIIAASSTTGSSVAAEDDILAERQRRRHRVALTSWAIRIGLAVIFVGAWQLLSGNNVIDPLLVSTPADVAKAIGSQFTDGSFWTDVLSTFGGAMAGLALGAVLGILSALAFSRSEILDRAFQPFLTLANSLPRPALAPIFILWFGLGFGPKALVAASVVYFVLLTNTLSALRTIDHDIELLTQSLSMRARQRFFKIELPSALPSVIGGLRLGAVYAVLGAVVSEMVGAYSGLGQRLVVMTNNFHVADSFAVLLAMGLMSMVLDYAISGLEHLVRSRTR